jgi:hypothetical protein
VHALGEGTDAGQVWFLAMLAVVAVPALALLACRIAGIGARRRATPPESRPTGRAPAHRAAAAVTLSEPA